MDVGCFQTLYKKYMEMQQNENQLKGQYANYFKIGQNAFEFLMDFGQYYSKNGKDRFHTRIINSQYYANIFLKSLQEPVERYEQTFVTIYMGEMQEVKIFIMLIK